MARFGKIGLGLVVAIASSNAAQGASGAVLRARTAVFEVEVQQLSSRAPLIGEVFLRDGVRDVGFSEVHESVGTATFIDGKLVTNYHVIEGGTDIVVLDHEGGRHTASVVFGDPQSDLAVLSLDESDWMPGAGLRLGSREVSVGEGVVALGYGGGEALALTEGIITAHYGEGRGVGAKLDRLWTDALITDGFSGGPLLNMRGECVGLIHAYGRPEGGLRDMGFVIPAAVMREALSPAHRWRSIGLTLSGTAARDGLIVEYVKRDSAAEKAGIVRKDKLELVNGEPLETIGRLRQLLHHNRSKTLRFEGIRDGEEREWSLEPRSLQADGAPEFKHWRGLEVEVAEEPGIYIVHVEAGSVGERSGLAVDDRIMGVNGVKSPDAASLWSYLAKSEDRTQLLLVLRGDQYLALPTGP